MKSRGLVWLLMFVAVPLWAETVTDTLWQMQQGIEWQRRQDERKEEKVSAIASLPSVGNDVDELTFSLLQAVNAYDTKRLLLLLEQYENMPNYDEDMVLFARAALAVQQNDLKRAIGLYRQLLASHPDFVRGQLDLARLLFLDKQNKEALSYFNHADLLVEHPYVRERIAMYQSALKYRDAWHGTLALGMETVSNIEQSSATTIYRKQRVCTANSSGNSQCVDISVPASTPPERRADGVIYETSVDKKLSLQGNHGLKFNAYAVGKIYRRYHDDNEHYLGATIGYAYEDRYYSVGIRPFYRLTFSGSHLQKRGVGVQLEVGKEWSGGTYTNGQFEYQYEYYSDSHYQRFNGAQMSVFLYAVQPLPNDWLVFLGYDYLRKNSQEKVDSYDRYGLRAGVIKQFPNVEWVANIALRHLHYKDYNTWLDTKRYDRQAVYFLSVKLTNVFGKKWVPALEYEFTRNRSSSWVNAYYNRIWRLKWRYAF